MDGPRRVLPLKGYAQHRGVSPAAVRKAIDSGRLLKSAVRDERTGVWQIDVGEADREWEAYTDPAKQREKAARKGGALSPPGPMPAHQRQLLLDMEEEVQALGKLDLSAEGLDPFPEDAAGNFQRLREVQAEYEARLMHLRFQREKAAVLPVEEVVRATFKVWREHRDKLLAISTRLAGLVAAETNPNTCERIMADAVIEALAELSASLRSAATAEEEAALGSSG